MDVGDGGSVERRLCFGQRRRMRFGFGLGREERESVCFVCLGKPTPFCGPSLVRLLGGKRPSFPVDSILHYHVSNFMAFIPTDSGKSILYIVAQCTVYLIVQYIVYCCSYRFPSNVLSSFLSHVVVISSL